MAAITQAKTAKPSVSAEVSIYELRSSSNSPQHSTHDLLLVALENSNHTFHLDQCSLPGPAGEKMKGLKTWYTTNQGKWQKFAAYVLCKKPYIAVGTLGVRSLQAPEACFADSV